MVESGRVPGKGDSTHGSLALKEDANVLERFKLI